MNSSTICLLYRAVLRIRYTSTTASPSASLDPHAQISRDLGWAALGAGQRLETHKSFKLYIDLPPSDAPLGGLDTVGASPVHPSAPHYTASRFAPDRRRRVLDNERTTRHVEGGRGMLVYILPKSQNTLPRILLEQGRKRGDYGAAPGPGGFRGHLRRAAMCSDVQRRAGGGGCA